MVDLDSFWPVSLLTFGNGSSGVCESPERGWGREGGRDWKGENSMQDMKRARDRRKGIEREKWKNAHTLTWRGKKDS